jgi:hypothetical protein
VLFATCVGWLTNARRDQIFAATAAYAAVLAVFRKWNFGRRTEFGGVRQLGLYTAELELGDVNLEVVQNKKQEIRNCNFREDCRLFSSILATEYSTAPQGNLAFSRYCLLRTVFDQSNLVHS